MSKYKSYVKYNLLQQNNKLEIGLISLFITALAIILDVFLQVPNPEIICFIAIVLSTFSCGFFCGSISGFLTILYCGYFFSVPGELMSYTDQNFYKMGVIISATVSMIVIVGTLKMQLKTRTEALEKANKELLLFSALDGLTGMRNRRSFDEMLNNAWETCLLEQKSIALIIIDVDFFKNYNDSYGHQAGDDCLRHISAAIISHLSSNGSFAARYGGEEFVVVMPGVAIDAAIEAGKRIRETVEDLNIPSGHETSHPHVTISLGINTALPVADMSCEEFVRKADFALYKAKTAGRNNVKAYSTVVAEQEGYC